LSRKEYSPSYRSLSLDNPLQNTKSTQDITLPLQSKAISSLSNHGKLERRTELNAGALIAKITMTIGLIVGKIGMIGVKRGEEEETGLNDSNVYLSGNKSINSKSFFSKKE
jgi:hypothetical protein